MRVDRKLYFLTGQHLFYTKEAILGEDCYSGIHFLLGLN